MDSRNILSLLGLAKRAGMLAAGEEPAEAAARAKDARVLLLAADAADNTRRRVEHFAQAGDCLWLRLPFTKDELGRAVGRTSVAIVALTDVGFAAAVVRRLAALDPERYGGDAGKLELKARRAAERRAEQTAHEKNLRKGKRRPKAPPPQTAGESPPPQAAAPAGEGPRQAPPKRPAVRRSPDRPGTAGRPRSGPSGPGGPRKGSSGPGRSRGGVSGPSRPGGPRQGPRPAKGKRPKAKTNPYAHSHPVKKGKGSFRKREG